MYNCTLVKFVGKNVDNIETRFCLPNLPSQSDTNLNNPVCVTPPKLAKACTLVTATSLYPWHFPLYVHAKLRH